MGDLNLKAFLEIFRTAKIIFEKGLKMILSLCLCRSKIGSFFGNSESELKLPG